MGRLVCPTDRNPLLCKQAAPLIFFFCMFVCCSPPLSCYFSIGSVYIYKKEERKKSYIAGVLYETLLGLEFPALAAALKRCRDVGISSGATNILFFFSCL